MAFPERKTTVLYTNADSIMNKLDLLQAHVCELNPDIIALTES